LFRHFLFSTVIVIFKHTRPWMFTRTK
jgi:hypothetical protein